MKQDSKKQSKLRSFWRYYVKGEYHCDQCPYAWSDYSDYLGDGNCGCYVKGDIQDSCRLIPPIRFLLGWGKKRRYLYRESQICDDMFEYRIRTEKKQAQFDEAVRPHFEQYLIVWKDENGNIARRENGEPDTVNVDDVCDYGFFLDCRSVFSVPEQSLKEQWASVLKNTWNRIADLFLPYFRN